MSWMQKLYDTYEICSVSTNLQSIVPLAPEFHVIQQAHIEIVLDREGNFRRARVIDKENTVIPATEQSATTRTSAVVPHPLSDHIKYCAADYREEGCISNKYYNAYHQQLKLWCTSAYSNPKAVSVLKYIEKEQVVADLKSQGVLPMSENGDLLFKWNSNENKPALFKQLNAESGNYKTQNALIRWIVEDDLPSETWKDKALRDSWIDYCNSMGSRSGICMVTGIEQILADKHPKGLRNGKDGAKLISYKKENESDFIYLGRFTFANQVVGVGSSVTQKAHSALRWLIERQGFKNGDQVIVAWAVNGEDIPDWSENTNALFLSAEELAKMPSKQEYSVSDTKEFGQAFALRLNKAIRGYQSKLGSANDIIILGLDAATKGRMAITYYRELKGSEYLDRIESWHKNYAWLQNYGMDNKTKKSLTFIGAPSPREIAEAAYGSRIDEKLSKSIVERLLPCIIDDQRIPRDLVESTIRNTSNRQGHEKYEWEKILGIACALFKGFFKEKEYKMKLETERNTLDYLYGRLLAIADNIEYYALEMGAESNRDTTAAKLMQRFADRPFSTWRTIELALIPYMARLHSSEKTIGFLRNRKRLLDEVICSFHEGDFSKEKDRPLTGEFLLGYHCQRSALFASKSIEGANINSINKVIDSITDLNKGE